MQDYHEALEGAVFQKQGDFPARRAYIFTPLPTSAAKLLQTRAQLSPFPKGEGLCDKSVVDWLAGPLRVYFVFIPTN